MRKAAYRLPKPGDYVGEYRVEEVLRGCGQSRAYRATHAGVSYFLKFLGTHRGTAWCRREVTLMLRHASPRVVQALGYGRWPDVREGCFWVAMEWVKGDNLARYAQVHNP